VVKLQVLQDLRRIHGIAVALAGLAEHDASEFVRCDVWVSGDE
jgi:hypothetical protein